MREERGVREDEREVMSEKRVENYNPKVVYE
jgi:hypothetical protein